MKDLILAILIIITFMGGTLFIGYMTYDSDWDSFQDSEVSET